VFGEGDGLPGLVLDRYGDVIVGQIATAGMEALRPDIEAAVQKVLAPQALVWKNDGGARELEQLPRQVIAGLGTMPDTLQAVEGVLQFYAAGRGAENRLVLRPGGQPRVVTPPDVARGARARRLQLRRRLGHHRDALRRA
jgi:hypothetical protein